MKKELHQKSSKYLRKIKSKLNQKSYKYKNGKSKKLRFRYGKGREINILWKAKPEPTGNKLFQVLDKGYYVTRRIYPAWVELNNLKLNKKLDNYFKRRENQTGKYQYFFNKGTQQISLIKLFGYWEIFAFEDKSLFTDCKRFGTMKEAVQEINNLFGK